MASDKLNKLLANVQRFNDELISYIQDSINENSAYIVNMNATDQLYELGVNTLGVSIADYAPYSPMTVEIKKEKGQPYNRVTLQDTGEFHASFYVDVRADEFEIMASDWKTEKLARQYGDDIFGLTYKNKMEVAWEYTYPDLLKKEKEVLYAGL